MMQARISIALATYNGARYLREQLESIFQQTLRPAEVIACDDGSRDGTLDILRGYAAAGRLELHVNAERLGYVQNFARAISLATGDLIALADQDDVWQPRKLERLAAALNGHLLVYSDAEIVDAEGREQNRTLRELNQIRFLRGSPNRAFLLYNCASGNTQLFRRDLVPDILPIPKGIRYHDSWIAFVASTLGTIDFVDEPLIRYRRHAGNVTVKKLSRAESRPGKPRRRIRRRLRLLRELRAYASFPRLHPADRRFFGDLLNLAENYRRTWINPALFVYLWRHRRELFAVKRNKKYLKHISRLSLGYRLHRLSLPPLDEASP